MDQPTAQESTVQSPPVSTPPAQPVSTPPVETPSNNSGNTSFTTKKVHIPRILLVLFACLISGVLFGVAGYFLGLGQRPVLVPITHLRPVVTPSTIPSPSISPTPSSSPSSITPASTTPGQSKPLTVSSVSPASIGPNAGPAKLTVTGTNFLVGAGISVVGPYDLATGNAASGSTLSTIAVGNVVFNSATELSGTLPSGLVSGYYKIVVTNPDGTSASSGLSLLVSGSSQ